MKREELQHDFHNEQGINWLNSQGEPDIDYVMWLENKILAIKNNTPLPPAEGVEKYYKTERGRFDFGSTKDKGWIQARESDVVRFAEEFATLHAQQMAEKMVEERLRKEYERGIEDGKIIGEHGSVSYIE